MAVSLKHAFNCAKLDGADITVVKPSNWNAEHTLTAAINKVLGTTAASTTVTELPLAIDASGNIDISGTIALSGSKGTAGQALVSAGPSTQPAWGTLPVSGGGTGATTAAAAASNLGLGNALKSDTTATITKGYSVTPHNAGSVSSGTFTPNPANGNYQYYTNNGAHTIAAPSSDCAIDILVTNGTAGSITFSGYTVGANTGSFYVTNGGNRFLLAIRRIAGVSTYNWYALQ